MGLKIKRRNCCDELWTCSNTRGSLPAQQNVRWMLYFLAFQCTQLPVPGTGGRDLWCCPARDSRGLAMAILGHQAPKIKHGCLQALPPVPTPLLTLSEWNNPAHGCPCPLQEGWNQIFMIFMFLPNPNHSVTSAQLCSSPRARSRSSSWLSRPGCVHCASPKPGKEQEEQSHCFGSCGCVDVPVAVCELCVCVCQSLCVYLSPQDASPRRIRDGFTPLSQNVMGTGIWWDPDMPGKIQGDFQAWDPTGSLRLVLRRQIIPVPPQVCMIGTN